MLLDERLPNYQLSSRHEIELDASQQDVWKAALSYRPGESLLLRILFGLRALPALVKGGGLREFSEGDQSLGPQLERMGFVKLGEEGGREIVWGLAGRFWLPAGGIVRLNSPQDFEAFEAEGQARAAMNIAVEPIGEERTRLSTKTRIQVFGDLARRAFRAYWSVVGPFSGWLRRDALERIAQAAVRGGTNA